MDGLKTSFVSKKLLVYLFFAFAISSLIASFFYIRISKPQIPDDSDLRTMVNETMFLFAESVKNEDFSDFYRSISSVWQPETSEEDLRLAFRRFTGQDFDFTIEDSIPVFTKEPFLDDDNLLILEGRYDTYLGFLEFNLMYILERDGWKLLGIMVRMNSRRN